MDGIAKVLAVERPFERSSPYHRGKLPWIVTLIDTANLVAAVLNGGAVTAEPGSSDVRYITMSYSSDPRKHLLMAESLAFRVPCTPFSTTNAQADTSQSQPTSTRVIIYEFATG